MWQQIQVTENTKILIKEVTIMKARKYVPFAMATILSLLAVNFNPVFANEIAQDEKRLCKK